MQIDGAQDGSLDNLKDDGIWFVYDGDCPICQMAAHALRIKKEYGDLHLLNAREVTDSALMAEINKRGYDLDEGMVIYLNGNFYHGKTALKFMARYGENKGLFNRFNKSLFWSDTLAKILYPLMRAGRNTLIHLRGRDKIRNLEKK
jgi:predicted DCC family thiol-disulfide oxidoreductase YuxK